MAAISRSPTSFRTRRCSVGRRLQLLGELGNDAVEELAGALQIALALSLLQLDARLLQLLLDLLSARELLLLALPGGRHIRRLLLQLPDLDLELLQPLAGGSIRLLSTLRARSSVVSNAVDLVDRLGLRIDLHPQPAAASSIKSTALSGRKRSVM
jgi:hypothetical protein